MTTASILTQVTHVRLSKSKKYFNYFKFENNIYYILNAERWEPYQGNCEGILVIKEPSIVIDKGAKPTTVSNNVNTLLEDVKDYIPSPVLRSLVEVYKDPEADRISLNITVKYEKELTI